MENSIPESWVLASDVGALNNHLSGATSANTVGHNWSSCFGGVDCCTSLLREGRYRLKIHCCVANGRDGAIHPSTGRGAR
jgi:hypothetical protein